MERQFIRTKDNKVYRIMFCDLDYFYCPVRDNPYRKNAELELCSIPGEAYGCCYKIPVEEVINRSEKIINLADTVVYNNDVYCFDEREFILYKSDDNCKIIEITEEVIDQGVYGAIWTKNGLTYICQMNENGAFKRYGDFEWCYYQCLADQYKERK